MHAIIFPNDPIKAYVDKGEIIKRYFNPKNIFSEISIISLDDSDVNPESASLLFGSTNTKIFPIGKISLKKILFYNSYIAKITKVIKIEDIDIIIAHNSTFSGFLAVKLGQIFKIPVAIFLHINPDKDIRAHLKFFNIKRKLFWIYSSYVLENYTLKHASKIICAYNFITDYLISRGVSQDRIEVIYHRININQFKREEPFLLPSDGEDLKVLCVGRIFERKNPENIIRAVKNLRVKLTLIGNGPYLQKMIRLSKKIGVKDKVNFIKSVPNVNIDRYFKEAHVFACVNDFGGVSKPVMEAMASSLPVVMKRPIWEKSPELIGDAAILTDGSTKGFEVALNKLSNNKEEIIKLGKLGFERVKTVPDEYIEQKEADIIMSCIKKITI